MSEKPKSDRSVNLPDGCWDWIDAYAKDKGMSPDDYLAYVINYFRADTSTRALERRVEDLERALARERASKSPGLPHRPRPMPPARPSPRYKGDPPYTPLGSKRG